MTHEYILLMFKQLSINNSKNSSQMTSYNTR